MHQNGVIYSCTWKSVNMHRVSGSVLFGVKFRRDVGVIKLYRQTNNPGANANPLYLLRLSFLLFKIGSSRALR